MKYVYSFPPFDVGVGAAGDADGKLAEQAEKVVEEALETAEEARAVSLETAAIEAMDVIVACETLLRMLPDGYADAAASMVLAKVGARGGWRE